MYPYRFYSPSPVVPYICNVVVIFKKIQGFLKVFDILFICKSHISLRDHGYLSLCHWDACSLKSFSNLAEFVRICKDLIAVFLFLEVLCACIQRSHHQIIRIHLTLFFINDDLAFFIKHKGYRTGSSDISASLCKSASYVSGCTVFIICKSLYDNCYAAGAVSFIGKFFKVICIGVSGCLFDTSFNGIVWACYLPLPLRSHLSACCYWPDPVLPPLQRLRSLFR